MTLFFSGKPYDLTWTVNQKQSWVACLSLPTYWPGAPLDDIKHSFQKIFQRMKEDKLKSLSLSVDSTGSWPIGCFVPKLLRAFIHYVEDSETTTSALNLSLVVLSSSDDNIERVNGICRRIIDGEEEEQSKITFIRIIILS